MERTKNLLPAFWPFPVSARCREGWPVGDKVSVWPGYPAVTVYTGSQCVFPAAQTPYNTLFLQYLKMLKHEIRGAYAYAEHNQKV